MTRHWFPGRLSELAHLQNESWVVVMRNAALVAVFAVAYLQYSLGEVPDHKPSRHGATVARRPQQPSVELGLIDAAPDDDVAGSGGALHLGEIGPVASVIVVDTTTFRPVLA